MRKCFLLSALFVISIFSYAQDLNLSFNHLSRVEGLSNDVNPYVYKDSRGFVWIGSIDGLNRFDGERVKIYRPNVFDTTAISGNIITSQFYEDTAANLWFTTYGSINCYVRAQDHFLSFVLKDLKGNALTEDYHAFNLDDNGKLWLRIGLREKGQLFQFDINNFQQSVHGPLKGQRNYLVKSAENNGAYIISTLFGVVNGMEISSLNQGRIAETNEYFRAARSDLPILKIFNVFAPSLSEIYFGSDKGLGIYSNTDGTLELFSLFQGQVLGTVWSVASLGSHHLLVSTSKMGVLVFDKVTKTFVKQFEANENDPFSLRSNHNYEVYVDRSNCIWISNWVNGLDYACLGKNKFGLLEYPELQIEPDQITSIIEDAEDKKWISTASNGILIIDNGKVLKDQQSNLQKLNRCDNCTIVDHYIDRDKKHWLIVRDWTRQKSTLYYRNNTSTKWNFVGSTDTEMTSVFHLKTDRRLLTTKLGVKNIDSDGENFKLSPCSELGEFSNLPFYKIYEDEDQQVYFTSNFDRVLIYSSEDIEQLKPIKTITQIGNVTDFLSQGEYVWVTSNTGLFKVNRKTQEYESYADQIEGLSSESMLMVVRDEKDNLWIKTQGDLIKYNLDQNAVRRYGTSDGIQYNETMYLPYVKTHSGEIWIAGPEGITYFHPDSITPYAVNAQPQITDIFINAEEVELDTFIGERKRLSLAHNENTLTFNFVACEYSNPERSKFRYRMTNYDPSWTEAGSQGLARYANIPWGNYAFEIQAANSDGIWSKEIKSLTIEIEPPWWATWWAYLIYAVAFLVGLRAYVLFKSRKLQRQNLELEKTVKERTSELAQSLTDLKATQAQLIQSEKMASLGEVTAGIAHEMQNPLNFVNNFSEVSKELIDEVYDEIKKGDLEETKVLVTNIEQNIDRIHRHGKRAEGIVRNLLEHSRAGSRDKVLTNINNLCEEFLRLSFRNIRSKETSFDTKFKISYDRDIPEIQIVQQEVGKVFLNVFNNAFYALNERLQKEENFQPLLSIKSEVTDNIIELKVTDNGGGIHAKHLDKIFQPFFTTKPTGKATGLGLSLAYDIINAHGGEISVDSTLYKGTTISIKLPIDESIADK